MSNSVFKLNKLMFLTLKTSFIIIITGLIINYKCCKITVTIIIIITYKLSLLIIIFNIINSYLKLSQL